MPLTTYKSDNDLPPFENYSMLGRTYRYFKGEPRYPFGYGLSYTTFAYSDVQCVDETHTGDTARVTVTVSNTGDCDGDEVVQLYVVHPQDGRKQIPLCALKGFKRIHLKRGESTSVSFTLTPEELALTETDGNLVEKNGQVTLFVGGGQPNYAAGVSSLLTIKGAPYQVW